MKMPCCGGGDDGCCGGDEGRRCCCCGEVNEGELDRAARGVFGVIALVIGLTNIKSLGGKLATALGVVLTGTAVTGFCGIYRILGIETTETCTIENLKRVFGK